MQFEPLLRISCIYFADLKIADGTFQWNKKEYFPYGTSTPRFKGPKFNSLFFIDIWVLLIKLSLFRFFTFHFLFLFSFYFIWLRVPIIKEHFAIQNTWIVRCIFFVFHLMILCYKLIVVFALERLLSKLVFFFFLLICCTGPHLPNQGVSNVFVV